MPEATIQLSDREQEILRLVATGASNQQIATSLDISINTVKVHMRNIFGKIGASSRTEATLYAMRLGLIDLGSPAEEVPTAAPPEAAPLADAAVLPALPERAAVAVADEVPHTLPPDAAVPTPLAPTVAPVATPVAEPAPSLPTTARWGKRGLVVLGGLFVLLIAVFGAYQFFLRGDDATAGTAAPALLNRWKTHTPLPQARSGFAVASYDGQLYAIGGQGPNGPLDTVARLDPASEQWVTLINKPTPVANVQAVAVGGRICVPGGEGLDGQPTAAFECYDPRGERWVRFAALPEPRSHYALASVEGTLYLFGGWDGAEYRAEVFAYDPDVDAWQTLTPMPTARRGAGAALIDNRVYVSVRSPATSGPSVRARPWVVEQLWLAPGGQRFVARCNHHNCCACVWANGSRAAAYS
jgi:DNA-binding CsgD family transcriptional regulator